MSRAGASRRPRSVGAAAELAHNINNLLTTITAAADAALARPVDAETRAELNLIKASAAGAASMLGRLLGGDRAAPRTPELIAIDPTIAEFAATLRRVSGPRIELRLSLGLPDGLVRIDAADLQHALLNLTINAHDAMPDGGVLEVRTTVTTLRQELPAIPQPIPPGRYASIELRDSGTGIAPELMRRVFAPFFTTRSAAGNDRRGTGLGLHSVRETARRFGGFVAMTSTPGGGTAVRLYVPVKDPPARPGAGRHVLVVEDEAAPRRYMRHLLDQQGWRVTAVADARSALRALSRPRDSAPPPDLLISDIGLPDMEGSILIRAARHILPDLPAILVSGYAEPDASAEPGRIAYLGKPFHAAELLDLAAALVASNPVISG